MPGPGGVARRAISIAPSCARSRATADRADAVARARRLRRRRTPLRLPAPRRARRRLAAVLDPGERHRLARPRHVLGRGRRGAGRPGRAQPRRWERRRLSRRVERRRRLRLRPGPHPPAVRHRRGQRQHPRLLPAAVADGSVHGRPRPACCAGRRSRTPTNCGRSRTTSANERRHRRLSDSDRHRRRRDGPVHRVPRVRAPARASRCSNAAGSATRRPRPSAAPAPTAATTSTRPTSASPTRRCAVDRVRAATGTARLVRCGCMNIAVGPVTPDLAGPTAAQRRRRCAPLGLPPEIWTRPRSPNASDYLRADVAHLDADAGLVDLAAVTATLLARARENAASRCTRTSAVTGDRRRRRHGFGSRPTARTSSAGALVVTAGHGTNDVLARLDGCDLQVPLPRDRPSEAKYFVPARGARAPFTADVMPVIAYLDTGIYVHPIVDGVIDAVKIGYYNPPDLPRGRTGIGSIADFVDECMPGLRRRARSATSSTSTSATTTSSPTTTSCSARCPASRTSCVGVGWRGTGYKFAPWVGRVLRRARAAAGHRLRHRPLRPGPVRRPAPARRGRCT